MKLDIFSLMIICGLILFAGSYALGPALSIIDSGSEVKVTLGEESKGYITSATTLSTLGRELTPQEYSKIQKSDETRMTYRSEAKITTELSRNWPMLRCEFNMAQIDFGAAKSLDVRAEGYSIRETGDMPGAELQMYVWNVKSGEWELLGKHNKDEDAVLESRLPVSQVADYLNEDLVLAVAVKGYPSNLVIGSSPIYYPSYIHIDQVYALAKYYDDTPPTTPPRLYTIPWAYIGAALIGLGLAILLARRRNYGG